MTTMMDAMTMSELNNDVSEPPKATTNTPDSSTAPAQPASQEGLSKVNRKKRWDSTWVRPMGITAGIVGIGTLFAVVKMSLPEAEVQSVDGGVVDSVRVDPSNDGRNELNEEQTKYLSEQDIANAEKDAREGVTNSLILSHPEASTEGVNYSSSERTDLGAVVDQRVSTAPKTIAQLRQENEDARNSLYDEAIDNEGRIYFIRKSDNLEIMPVDSVPNSPRPTASNTTTAQQPTAQGTGTANPNATYAYSNNDYNAGGGNQGGNDGSAGGGQGGNGGGQATGSGQTNQNEQQQQAQPDPEIEAKRGTLKSDFEDYQAQNSQLEQQYQQQQQFLQQQYQQRQQYRSEQANTALNNAINQIQTIAGTRNSYAPLSYSNPNANVARGNNQNQTNNSQSGTPSFSASDFGLGSQADSGNGSSSQAGGSNPNQPQLTPASNTNNYAGNLGFGGSNYGTASQPTGEILDQRLPINVVRAGTKWQAVITNSVNTDDGLQVVGQLVNGKFAGSTVYGIVAPSGRNVGVRFSTIAPTNPRKPLIPIDSYATTLLQNKTAVSNDVSYHYMQNYGIKGLTSILRGVGEAYEGAGEKTIVTENGKVITTKDSEPTSKVIRANVLKELGADLTNDIARLGNRAPTYRIPIGTVVNVVLASDLDVNATTSTVAGSGINTGIGGNRNTNQNQ